MGAGSLTINSRAFLIAASQVIVNQGTLNLNAGNNTIQFANYLATWQGGATVQLNGNSQIVEDLLLGTSTARHQTGVGHGRQLQRTITGSSGSHPRPEAATPPPASLPARSAARPAWLSPAAAGVAWTLTQSQTYSGPDPHQHRRRHRRPREHGRPAEYQQPDHQPVDPGPRQHRLARPEHPPSQRSGHFSRRRHAQLSGPAAVHLRRNRSGR